MYSSWLLLGLEPGEPLLRVTRRTEAPNGMMRIRWHGQDFRIFPASLFIGCEGPDEKGIATEESAAPAFAVTIPKLWFSDGAPEGLSPQPPLHQRQGII